jgi:hypothetical protein
MLQLGPDRVDAATITATRCSSSNVQTAINPANNGDTESKPWLPTRSFWIVLYLMTYETRGAYEQ